MTGKEVGRQGSGARLSSLGSRVMSYSIDRKTLILVVAAMAALCAYRAIDYWVTGFYVSDEFGYVNAAMTGTVYSDRWFFGWVNIALFRILGLDTPTEYWLFLPFYLFLWSSLTIYAFYRTVKLVGFDQRAIALSLFSSLFLVSFVLLSLGFLTEPVGLSLSMAGIYFMVRWLKEKHYRNRSLILSPLLAALCFSAAAGTREPYLIFPVGCIFLVPLVLRAQNKNLGHLPGNRRNALLAASALAFIIPSLFFLQYPNALFFGQVTPTAADFAGGISQALPGPQASTTTTLTVFGNFTSTYTFVSVVSGNSTTVTKTTTQTSSIQVVSTAPPQPNPLAKTRLGNTVLIFLGGIILGWGPILFLVGLGGFLLLLASLRKADSTRWLVFFLALFSAGSYFVVSFIFSTDPFYLSFFNYSTIIRFSDTALPTYFLCAPVVFSILAKRKKQAVGVVLVLLLFVVAAVPVYETYASSSLVSYTGGNPFALGFRTDAVQIRDYVSSHQGDSPFYIIGWPNGWNLTPGTDLLANTHVYGIIQPGQPPISYQQFLSDRWSAVYIYYTSNADQFKANAPYFLPLIEPGATYGNATSPFSVVNRQPVLQGSGFSLIKVSLVWS
jgi:hypothetical protein